MKWLLAAGCLAAFPALAVYQPSGQELQLLQKNRDGLEQNMKNALPLQAKVDVCIGYIKNIGVQQGNNFSILQYWGIVKHYVDLSTKYATDRYPRLYYYDQKLYEKFGPYPKDNSSISKLFDTAIDSNYLNAKNYINIAQEYSQSLRQKDLNKICIESVSKKMRGQLFPATASMDKLFYPGITSGDRGTREGEADYQMKFYEHLDFTQLLNKIQASYY